MDYRDNFSEELWEKVEPEDCKGLVTYNVFHPQYIAPGTFRYAVKEVVPDDQDDSAMEMAQLEGALGKSDPLNSIRYCEMVIKEGIVVVVAIDGDCIKKK